MRQETNNEIDLLLRRMSRHDGGATHNGEVRIGGEHLDADELSSYAQNALPAAARARYTAHLADCSACRKLVTELSLSLGATAPAHIQTIPAPGGLKKFLASLFAPMVLRYAVPALGVIVVMVVGFIVMRQQQSDKFMALQREPQPGPAAVRAPEAPAQTASTQPTGSSSPANPAEERAEDFKDQQERARKPSEATPESKAVSEENAAPAPPPQASPAKDERADAPVIAQRQVEALPAASVAPPKFMESEEQKKEEQKKLDAVAKKQANVTVDGSDAEVTTKRANEPATAGFQAAQGATAGRRGLTKNKVADNRAADKTSAGATVGVAAASPASRSRAEEDNDKTETRSISGRHFRKERGIWIDTAYDSSKDAVKVTRGSEQFRALVADEPGIRTIAEQLDGEVIVVWKGRTYRIR